MYFEYTAQAFFGMKAYQIASGENNPRSRAEWLGRMGRWIMRRANELDAPLEHRRILMALAESFEKRARSARAEPWELVYSLLRLVACLFGYVFGERPFTPAYWQTRNSYFYSRFPGSVLPTDVMNEAISIRRGVAEKLRQDGCNDFKISLVLNTTEYEVKKLRRDLRA